MNVAFNEVTSRNIRALAALEGKTPDEYLNRYALDIANTVRDRGGIEALEAAVEAAKKIPDPPIETSPAAPGEEGILKP